MVYNLNTFYRVPISTELPIPAISDGPQTLLPYILLQCVNHALWSSRNDELLFTKLLTSRPFADLRRPASCMAGKLDTLGMWEFFLKIVRLQCSNLTKIWGCLKKTRPHRSSYGWAPHSTPLTKHISTTCTGSKEHTSTPVEKKTLPNNETAFPNELGPSPWLSLEQANSVYFDRL